MRRQGLSALAVAVFVCLVAMVASGQPLPRGLEGSGSEPTSGSASISIAAVANYAYEPDSIGNVPLNATITVTFTDDDVLPHTFNISSREGFRIPNDYTAAQLNELFSEYPPLYAVTVSFQGDVSVGHFTSPSAPGWYEFVCNESGHFSEGMYGFIAFGEPVPSNLTPPTHGSEIPIAGSALIAALGVVVIAAILVVVAIWRRRRSVYRLPPEQLH